MNYSERRETKIEVFRLCSDRQPFRTHRDMCAHTRARLHPFFPSAHHRSVFRQSAPSFVFRARATVLSKRIDAVVKSYGRQDFGDVFCSSAHIMHDFFSFLASRVPFFFCPPASARKVGKISTRIKTRVVR